MNDSYLYVIIALLPLAALMLVLQVNPYNALVIRGILGAVAALVYAVLGAADVALTEALVGTMLAITLYAVAVRSSLVMRVGVLDEAEIEKEDDVKKAGVAEPAFEQLMEDLRTIVSKYHLRLELIPYPSPQSLQQALIEKEVHATCIEGWRLQSEKLGLSLKESEGQPYHTLIRVHRLYEILQKELSSPATGLSYLSPSQLNLSNSEEKH